MASFPVAGLDIGTTRIKLVLYNERLEPVKEWSLPSPLSIGRDGSASHDPARLLTAVDALLDKARREGARSVGVSLYRASVVAWTPPGDPVGDIVLWLDRPRRLEAARAIPPLGRLAARLPVYRSILSPQSPLPLIAQLARERRAPHVWTLDALIIERYTGRFESDASNAALSGLISPYNLKPIPLAARLAGLPRGYRAPRVTGNRLEGEGRIQAVIADQQAGIVGLGCLGGGCVKLALGTGAFADKPLGGRKPGLPRGGLIPLVVALEGDRAYYAVESLVPGLGLAIADVADALGGFQVLHSLSPSVCLERWKGAILVPYPAGPGGGLGLWRPLILGGSPLAGGRWGLACSAVIGAGLAAAMIAGLHGEDRLVLTGRLASIPLLRHLVAALHRGVVEWCPWDPSPRGAAALAALPLEEVRRLERPPCERVAPAGASPGVGAMLYELIRGLARAEPLGRPASRAGAMVLEGVLVALEALREVWKGGS